jgi:glycosyltransferase involved in cell wall biosynthesis
MMPNVYPGVAAKKFGLPLVVSPRGTLSAFAFNSGSRVKRLFWPLLQRPAIEHAACFHATAVSEANDIRRYGFKQPIAVIPNGIDLPKLVPKLKGGPRTLLFLGRIHPIKGLDLLLEAWERLQLRHPDWILRIVGPDDVGYGATLRQLAARLDLKRVFIEGPLWGERKFEAYRQAQLFVLPTRSENFGVAVAEALASGTPAVVTHGAPWAGLEPAGAGRWVAISTESLFAGLSSAMSLESGELALMGSRAREWMERDFSWNRVGDLMIETYRWILEGGAAPECVIQD